MKIVWDEIKRRSNVEKHGLDFAALDPAFFESAVVLPSHAGRRIAIGWFEASLVIVTVFRPMGTEAISIVSMRHASRKERSLL